MIYNMNPTEKNKARKCAKTLEAITGAKDVVFATGEKLEIEVFDDKGKYLYSLQVEKVK